DQALKRVQEALALARELAHPFSLAMALSFAAAIHLARGEWPAAQERAEALITLCVEQGFTMMLAYGTMHRGQALVGQGQTEEGIAQMQQSLSAIQATGARLAQAGHLMSLAATYAKVGQVEEGFTLWAEALALMNRTGEWASKGWLYMLQGWL